jgi:hypothetical protein
MQPEIKTKFAEVWSADRPAQYQAFLFLQAATAQPVDWAYEVWGECLGNLSHPDNHNRAIAAQLLCALAGSDPEVRMLRDFPALLVVTRDERFVTARHCLQSLWKVGAAGTAQLQLYMHGLTARFKECVSEKNCTLVRYDILQSLRKVFDLAGDESIRTRALALIESEPDLKYRKKYAGLWRSGRAG